MVKKLIYILTMFFWLPLTIILGLNAINSFLRTGYFDLNQYVEIVKWKWDNPIWMILGTAMGLAALYWLVYRRKTDAEKLLKITLSIAGTISLLAILLFRSIAKCDSEFVSNAAVQFLENNYEAFSQGQYLYMYPFQIGVTALLEAIYRIFGVHNYIVFQLLNLICILSIVKVLCQIGRELFGEEVYRIELVLSMGLFPLFLLATFVYGDYIGLFFAIHGIAAIIQFLKREKWKDILIASVWLMCGVIVKNNVNVFVIAAVITLLLYAVLNQKYWTIAWAVGLAIVAQMGLGAVKLIYEWRMGQAIPSGIPKIAWIAMSMQETVDGGSASGWYNGYNWSVFADSGYDTAIATSVCKEVLKERFCYFLHHPQNAVSFFFDKFSSQWNEPTFMSLQTNEWYSRNCEPQSSFAIFLLYGTGRIVLTELMNVYHFLIMSGAAIGLWLQRKEWSLEKAYLILNIFGGVLFHMLWEAKARYVLCYFVLLLPLAAVGIQYVLLKVCKRNDKEKANAGAN